jgi:acyl-CoA-binding protein
MRAEELIAEIYRQKTELQNEGKKPHQVIMSMEAWRHIRAWHLARGVMEQAAHMDYIGEDRIFEMDVLIDGVDSPKVI